ncbi:MAG: DNA polymerase Y family protein [Candidatus Omnitrophota bacterium]
MPWSANTNKTFIHIDCDAFFTSVEQALNPELRGKPVVTGKERGIVACASYEAKALGVRRPMALHEARKICPSLICLPSDYETYSLYSRRFHGILRRFTPDVEEYSIDEAFAELSGLRRVHHASYEEIALKIKETVERELGITVSVGLSSTKSLAKIFSKEKKPAGFTSISTYDLLPFLKNISVERVCGFGPNSVALLKKHGIDTVFEFISRPCVLAKKLFGKIGVELWHELKGEAVYPIIKEAGKAQASLSKTKTFTPPSGNRDFVRAQLLRNLESAFIKLRRHGLRAAGLSIYLTDGEFKSRGLYAELTRPTGSTLDAAAMASKLFDAIFDPRLKYRRTGVLLTDLEPDREMQYDLFEDPCRIKALREISRVVDEVNSLYGKHALHLGATDPLGGYGQHLGERGDVASRKIRLLKGETKRQRLRIPLWNVKV